MKIPAEQLLQQSKALVEFPWAISIILYIKSACSRPILEMEHTSTELSHVLKVPEIC